MSNRELKSEAIRLINEIDANRMEDLVSSIRAFNEQQNADIDMITPQILEKLNQSLRQAEAGQLISNDDVANEVKRVLRDKMDAARQA